MVAWVIESTSKKKFNPLARYIMHKQKTNFSHMAILITNGENKTQVYHATWPLAESLSYEEFISKYEIKNIYALTPPLYKEWNQLIELLHNLVKQKSYYSITQLILIYLKIKFSLLNTALKMAILNHEKGLICSELIARFLNYGWEIQFSISYDSLDLIETSKAAKLVEDKSKKWQG